MERRTERLDTFDRKILAILQEDVLTSQREIGERVALSAAAVNRRIRDFQSSGTISSNVAIVNPERVGRAITIIAQVSVESERPEHLEKLKTTFAEAPEVQQCYYVTGDCDFILVITVKDMREYEDLTKRIFFSQDNVKKFSTYVTMDRVKASLFVPT